MHSYSMKEQQCLTYFRWLHKNMLQHIVWQSSGVTSTQKKSVGESPSCAFQHYFCPTEQSTVRSELCSSIKHIKLSSL